MRQSLNTRQFLASLPAEKTVILKKELPEDFSTLSRYEKVKLSDSYLSDESIVMRCDGESLFCGHLMTTVKRRGDNLFRKADLIHKLTIRKNRIALTGSLSQDMLSILDIEWTKDIFDNWSQFISKPSILRAVLTRKVYNIETLVREIYWRLYRIRIQNWKEGRYYLDKASLLINFGLTDINAYTVDANASIRALNSLRQKYNSGFITHADLDRQRRLMEDLLKSAIMLGEKVNLEWSVRRMEEEHLRQTRELMGLELPPESDTPIHAKPIEEEGIALINSEKAIYQEGHQMHHCLYTNYRDRIKEKRYVAYHMSFPEDCTFGICIQNGRPSLDQVYLKYDEMVREDTRRCVEDFIERRSPELLTLFDRDYIGHIIPDGHPAEDLPFE